MPAPVVSGWSGCRVGLAPTGKRRPSRRTWKADIRSSRRKQSTFPAFCFTVDSRCASSAAPSHAAALVAAWRGALMSDLLNGTEDGDKNAIESDTAQESVASTAAANAPEEKPATPDKPEASNEALVEDLTKKAHDLDAVRKSVEDAASTSGTLWFSYLFTLLYIAIAAGAVTHKDLLLENPVKLPFLNVELPLVAFFALAPILFIIAHAYTLMHFVMLAAKVGTYEREAFW
jgi:hypothetical protein